mmetsp:Transcript_29745/g.45989  ORF Transcript_29745/g.45989 Transcript_29745/m.45989 type:complete len:101 (+) Transcript_29745:1307-1609(+)
MGISVRSNDFEEAFINRQQRDIECTTTEIEHEDISLAFLVQTVRNGSSSRLVDDSGNVESGDCSCVLGGLALSIVEVRRDGHDGVLDSCSQVALGDLLHL